MGKLIEILRYVAQPVLQFTLLFEALMKLIQLQWKFLMNKNLPSFMVYVHKNKCQLFHMGNEII